MSAFGDRLKALRHAAGLSQTELAGEELSPSYVSLLESGKRQASPEAVEALARRLGCRPIDLDTGADAAQRTEAARLELTYAALDSSRGDHAGARSRLEALLADPGLDRRTADEVRLQLANTCELADDLTAAIGVLGPLFERCLQGECHLPVTDVGLLLCGDYVEAGELTRARAIGQAALDAAAAARLTGTDQYIRLAVTVTSIHYESGDLTHARALAVDLIAMAEEHGSPAAQGSIYWNAAVYAETAGRIAEAVELSGRALELLARSGPSRDLLRLRITAALIALRANPRQGSQTAATLDGVADEIATVGGTAERAAWDHARAVAHLAVGEAVDAERLARRCLLHLTGRQADEMAGALVVLGDALRLRGDLAGAVEQYRAALDVLGRRPASRQVALTVREVADRLLAAEQFDDALGAYARALDVVGLRPSPVPVADGAARR